jgi:hypothetical protein
MNKCLITWHFYEVFEGVWTIGQLHIQQRFRVCHSVYLQHHDSRITIGSGRWPSCYKLQTIEKLEVRCAFYLRDSIPIKLVAYRSVGPCCFLFSGFLVLMQIPADLYECSNGN